MNWFLVAYLIILAYLTVQKRIPFGGSWSWLGVVAISHFVFALIRAGNARNPRDIVLVEIWASGFEWLFLGISIICLARALEDDSSGNTPT